MPQIFMSSSNSQYPQMTYKQAVKHCKYWADQIRHDGLDLLTTDYGAAIGVSDQLAYPLDMQEWISAPSYPDFMQYDTMLMLSIATTPTEPCGKSC